MKLPETIKVRVCGTDFDIPAEEARGLYEQLHVVFGNSDQSLSPQEIASRIGSLRRLDDDITQLMKETGIHIERTRDGRLIADEIKKLKREM